MSESPQASWMTLLKNPAGFVLALALLILVMAAVAPNGVVIRFGEFSAELGSGDGKRAFEQAASAALSPS